MHTDKVPRLRELTDDDVLLGRGFPAIENEGNVRFRELVRSRSAEYHAAYRRHTKDSIARDVVNTIHRRSGRFLTQVDEVPNIKGLVIPSGARVWTEADEAAVLIKAKQALRDHSEDSKEGGRSFSRRRPAAGSGNMVLEWVVPARSPTQQVGGAPQRAESSGSAAAHSPNVAAAARTQQPFHLPSLFGPATQQILALNPEMSSSLGLSVGAAGGNEAAALMAVAARQQQQGMFLSAGQLSQPANVHIALQQLLERQSRGSVIGDANVPVGLASLLQNTSAPSVASLPASMFASQAPTSTRSDQGAMSATRHGVSSTTTSHGLASSQSSTSLTSGQQTASTGSRSSIAIQQATEKAATATGRQEGGNIPLCDVEVRLLNVLCSFGLPDWKKDEGESSFASTLASLPAATREEGSLGYDWRDVGKHLVAACQSTASFSTAKRLSTDLRTLARMAICLVGRCVDCSRIATTDDAQGSTAPPVGSGAITQVDASIVRHVLTQRSLELGDSDKALDGSCLGGTLIEVLKTGGDEKRAISSTPQAAVAALLSSTESATIVGTIATLAKLRWVFQHPTATIFSLLSSQGGGGDTSRDYLLLKGVLEHGLANELDFRMQGSSLTRDEIESLISLLTNLLFKNLQSLRQKETLSSLQQKYTMLMSA